MALQQHFGTQDLRGKKYVLTWTYHPKPLNTAVANSALQIATRFGMDVTLLCPDARIRARSALHGFRANRTSPRTAARFASATTSTTAYRGADVVYAKSWGALPYFGRWDDEKPIREAHKNFIVDEAKMELTNDGVFSHCLPLRRNVKATDAVMDSPACIAIDEAENRLHVQKAIMVGARGGRQSGMSDDRCSNKNDVVLAFSGGLDTSFCMPYLQERGYAVHTVFADTGGVDADERAYIEAARAANSAPRATSPSMAVRRSGTASSSRSSGRARAIRASIRCSCRIAI